MRRLIETEASAAGLKIGNETKEVLSALLGADRLTTRSELAKLMLYAHGKGEIEESDVAAIVADASALHLDAAVNGAFSGDYAAVSDTAAKVFAAGTIANALLAAALWHGLLLHKIKLETERGTSLDVAVERHTRAQGFARRAAHQEPGPRVAGRQARPCHRSDRRSCPALPPHADLAEEIAIRALWSVALMAKSGRTEAR